MITTTLNAIRAHSPCESGWKKLLAHLGKTQADDEPLPFATILASNGLDDALWCCRAAPDHDKEWHLYTVWCARDVVERHEAAGGEGAGAGVVWGAVAARAAAGGAACVSAAPQKARLDVWGVAWNAALAAQEKRFLEIVGAAQEK